MIKGAGKWLHYLSEGEWPVRQQVGEIARKLKGSILYADKHPFAGGKDHYAVYFEDPDRMKVELVAP
ncbi:hypothetical protein L3139_24030 [[Brevibacterium] frigoritolerans]|uniref:hypothetical protein n=1 Tax=Peribacillus TaxID=2675229 RepID=UPI00066182BF|nr:MULTISPECIES: hypothetical protein [Bacillaceae]MCF7624758.1 hypothetical protein [Peribacillus frigoritolerans]MEA3574940.1 hypothetical protein [Peribacillus frigoritolerans]